MKLRSIVIATAIFLIVSGFALSEAKPVKQKRKYLPIAKIDVDSGKIQIRTKILRKTFKDGGKISRFEVKKFADGYNLLRIGKKKDGANYTEALPLKLAGNKLLFYELKKFVTCSMVKCDFFCMPNYEKTACECGHGEDCTFGIDVSGMGIDTVTVDNFTYPPAR